MDDAHKRPRDYQALINPGAVDTIRELPRRGVRVALASSSPMVSIEEVLNACGLSDAFEYVVSGEQFKESKPEPTSTCMRWICWGCPRIAAAALRTRCLASLPASEPV